MGRDSASSAQLKRTEDSETALLQSSWGDLGYMGGDGDVGGERGASQCVGDGGGGIGDVETQGDVVVVIWDVVGVGGSELLVVLRNTGGRETARSRPCW